MTFQQELLKSLTVQGDSIAIEDGNRSVTYADILDTANKITAFLLSLDLEKETIIGINVKNKPDLICTIIGVANARCVFVTLDPGLPDSRLTAMVDTMNLQHIISSSDSSIDFEHQRWNKKLNNHRLEHILAKSDISRPYDIPYPEFESDDSLYLYFTSGSTGTPKGIVGKNCSLLQFVQWEISEFKIEKHSRFSQFITPYFDAFLRDIFVPLMAGATVCVPPEDEDFYSSEKLIPWIDTAGITLIHCVPSLFRVINTSTVTTQSFNSLKYVLMSGEKINPSELNNWYNTFGSHIQLVNLYGTTETTMVRSCYRIVPEDTKRARIPIGSPIADTEILVANKDLEPTNLLVPGDLYIISKYVTKGYLNDKELTSKKFLKIRTEASGETIAFRTGDRARKLPDGKIELLGREDRQIKLRGLRIELDEVEAVLNKFDAVKDTSATLHADSHGNDSLVVFFIRKEDLSEEVNIINNILIYAKAHLPTYMVPSRAVEVEEFPLLSNGKIHYKELAEYLTEQKEIILPTNWIEEEILSIWKDLLGDKPISTDDKFYHIGGNSLTTMRLISRINGKFDVRILLSQLFQNPTIKEQANLIADVGKDDQNAILKAPKADHYKLSLAQERLYFLYQFDRQSLAYNMPQIVKLTGKLDKNRLEEVINKLIARHESLRSSFSMLNGRPTQKVLSEAEIQLETHNAKEKKQYVHLVEEFIRPFDLHHAPLIRAGVIQVSDEEHILMIDLHHIISDGVSQEIMIRDFMALYNGETLPALKLQYKDFATWQHTDEQQKKIAAQADFWKQTLSDIPTSLEVPTDFVRPLIKDHKGARITFELSQEDSESLSRLSASENTTKFMVLLSIFNILLSKISNQEDIIIGTPIIDRLHHDLEEVVGVFINALLLRNRPQNDHTFKSFLCAVKSSTLSSFDNKDYPYEELINVLDIERDTSRNSLFDVMFAYQNFKEHVLSIPGLTLEPFDWKETGSKFDLTLFAYEGPGNLVFTIEYATSLFKEETIHRFIGYFEKIIAQVVADVNIKLSTIEIISQKEKELIIKKFNHTYKALPKGETLVSLFEKQVIQTPESIAVVFEDNKLTYKALNEEANQLAYFLKEKQENKSIVPVMMQPSVGLLISMLGIYKAGMVYVPTDINAPKPRIISNLRDLASTLLITESRLIDNKKSFFEELAIETHVENLLYLDTDKPANGEIRLFNTLITASRLMAGQPPETLAPFELYDGKRSLGGQQFIEEVERMKQVLQSNNDNFKDLNYGLLLSNPLLKVKAIKALQELEVSYAIITTHRGVSADLMEGVQVLLTENEFVQYVDSTFWNSQVQRTLVLLEEYDTCDKKETTFKDIWNQIANQTSEALNDYGWSSSYTGEAFSIDEMNQYTTNFNEKLAPHLNSTSRVLEIGCGRGVVLFEIAPKVGYYHATDLAKDILPKNKERLKRENIEHVFMEAYGASEIKNIEEKGFDVVVCSSVVHYFPDTFYLENVISDAIDLLNEEGIIYLDDLINLDEKENLITSTNEYKKIHPEAKVKTNWSNDLFVGAEFFEYIKINHPEIVEVEITRKIGDIDNELTRYRFDVLLSVNKKSVNGCQSHKHDAKKRIILENVEEDSLSLSRKSTSDQFKNEYTLSSSISALSDLRKYSVENPVLEAELDDLSYIIFTSGTTGKPKGAMVHHRGMLNHLMAKINDLSITKGDVIAQTAPASFDISIWQFLASLLVGGHCHIISKEKLINPALLIDELQKGEVTIFESVPSLITAFLDGMNEHSQHTLKNLRWMVPTGEALSVELTRKWYSYFPNIKLLNAYGPTEASDDVTHHIVDTPGEDQLKISIGRPVQNTHVYILDRYLNLCPPGIEGEICVAGLGVGRGYWNDDEKTEKAFIQNPFAGEIDEEGYNVIYRTGDIGCFREDGTILCLGRMDEQVKIRGNRIELGEINSTLAEYPEVEEVVVDAKTSDSDKYLVAYYVSSKQLEVESLKKFVASKLPGYMIPSYWVQMDKFPLTVNGKLNRKALPEPTGKFKGPGVGHELPSNEIEEKLVEIWSEILKLDKSVISVTKSFFELGGHSLNAIILSNRIFKAFNLEIPLSEIFTKPSIRLIGEYIDTSIWLKKQVRKSSEDKVIVKI